MNDDAPIRSIEVEVEVPGTPEQVWEAIATGPGIEAWFVAAEIDGRPGGMIAFDHLGAGLEESGVVTAWDPPHRFAGEEKWNFEGRPEAKLGTEFLVDARSGGTCVVRVVTSLFASGGDWGRELDSMREGWSVYLHNLRMYLTHFPGQRCSSILVIRGAAPPLDRAWSALTGALGLSNAVVGQPAATASGVPAVTGVVERVAEDSLTLRVDRPAPGFVLVHAFSWLDQVYASFHAYLFGDEGAAVAAREETAWRAWMDEHFPAAAPVP